MAKDNKYRVQYLRYTGAKWQTYQTFPDEAAANELADVLVKKLRYVDVRVLAPSGGIRQFKCKAADPPPGDPQTGRLRGYQAIIVVPPTFCGQCHNLIDSVGYVPALGKRGPVICTSCLKRCT